MLFWLIYFLNTLGNLHMSCNPVKYYNNNLIAFNLSLTNKLHYSYQESLERINIKKVNKTRTNTTKKIYILNLNKPFYIFNLFKLISILLKPNRSKTLEIHFYNKSLYFIKYSFIAILIRFDFYHYPLQLIVFQGL